LDAIVQNIIGGEQTWAHLLNKKSALLFCQRLKKKKETKRNDNRVLDPTCGLCIELHTAKHERVEYWLRLVSKKRRLE
jgi:hypothetical protein